MFLGLHKSAVEPGGGSPPPAAPVSPAVPASPADGSAAAPPAASPDSPGLRQLREQYEQTKAKYEPYEKLGAKPEELQRSHQTFQRISTEATKLGQQLGYDPQEVIDALSTDPIQTLTVLRQMAQQAAQNEKPLSRADIERLADQRAKEALKPFQLEREQRLDADAERAFDGEVDRQLKTSFPNGLPDSNKEALQGLAWALLLENKEGYTALRAGNPSAVAAAFEKAKTTLLKIVADYGEHEKTRTGAPTTPRAPQAPSTKAGSIDDIIANLGNPNVSMDKVFSGR